MVGQRYSRWWVPPSDVSSVVTRRPRSVFFNRSGSTWASSPLTVLTVTVMAGVCRFRQPGSRQRSVWAAARRSLRSSPRWGCVPEPPHLLRPTAGHRDLPRPQPRGFRVGHVDDGEAAEVLFGLGVWTVGDQWSAVRRIDAE